jgi:hypothetical protein
MCQSQVVLNKTDSPLPGHYTAPLSHGAVFDGLEKDQRPKRMPLLLLLLLSLLLLEQR